MIHVASLHIDRIFKKAFGVPVVFRAFARDVLAFLGADPSGDLDIDTVHMDFRFPTRVGAVDLVYDLFGEDARRRVIVEMQHRKRATFFDRFFYYHAVGLVEQVPSHRSYRFQRSVYTVVLLTDRDGVPDDIDFASAWTDLSLTTETGERVAPYPHRLVFLIAQKVPESQPGEPALYRWLRLIRDSLTGTIDETQYTGEAFERVLKEIRLENLTQEDRDAMAVDYDELEAVRERAEAKTKQEIARRALASGLRVEAVADLTGLSLEEIAALAADGEAGRNRGE